MILLKTPFLFLIILPAAICGQPAAPHADSLFHPQAQPLFLNADSRPLSFSQYTTAIFNHYQNPKLPFFCGMEDRFRNRFHVYLKLRAGTDEQYEKMIHAADQ